MKKANLFALAVFGLNAMLALNETEPLAQTPGTPGVSDLSSLTAGLSSDSQGTFPYLAARWGGFGEFRHSANLGLRTARPASYGPRSTWLTRYLGSNGYRPRFDAQHSLRKGTRVRLVVTGAPQPACYRTPTFGSCQLVTGYSIALLEAFAALDDDTRKLVRKSMALSDYVELRTAAAALVHHPPASAYKFVDVSDSDLDGHEVDLDSF